MSETEHTTPTKRPRAKRWVEVINVRLAKGGKARIDAVLEDDEDRLELIRDAIDREVARREKLQRKAGPPPE